MPEIYVIYLRDHSGQLRSFSVVIQDFLGVKILKVLAEEETEHGPMLAEIQVLAAIRRVTDRAMEQAGVNILSTDPANRLAQLFTVLIGERDLARQAKQDMEAAAGAMREAFQALWNRAGDPVYLDGMRCPRPVYVCEWCGGEGISDVRHTEACLINRVRAALLPTAGTALKERLEKTERRLKWVYDQCNDPTRTVEQIGRELCVVIAGGIVGDVIHENPDAAIDAAVATKEQGR